MSLISALPTHHVSASPDRAVRVLVVDDSAVMRRLVIDTLTQDPAIEVIGYASNGEGALEKASRLRPDVITLDVEMPGMDGIETLKHLRATLPSARTVMFSSLTERGAPVTLKALMYGASDYCAKPTGFGSSAESRDYLRRELLPRVRQFSRSIPGRLLARKPELVIPSSQPVSASRSRTPEAVVIGISTGGPQSLAAVMPQFPVDFPVPILIVQHMPPQFTGLFAKRLDSASAIKVEEAQEGQLVRAGAALVAPGGFHMRVARKSNRIVVTLDQEEPENSCRPAVDVLFRAAAEVWGGNVLAAVFTGMGHDGLRGAQQLKSRGATVIVQDEPSSIVWGMPGAIANAGLADQILDLHQIVPSILQRIRPKS